MVTKTLMSVEEYLHTSFDGCDCEYLDGDIVERNMGEMGHSKVQYTLMHLLGLLQASLGLQIMPEIRIRISSSRYRIPDIGVWLPGDIGKRIPTVPPFLAIEILSPDDRWPRMHTKIQEYLGYGIQWIWVIDPEEGSAWCFSQGNPSGTPCDVLRTEDPVIEIPLSQVLDPQA
jgi:Uma2 family endonuclease